MTFGTFFLYFVGSIVLFVVGSIVLFVVGWIAVKWLIVAVAVGTMSALDGARRLTDRRAADKWQKIENELEDRE